MSRQPPLWVTASHFEPATRTTPPSAEPPPRAAAAPTTDLPGSPAAPPPIPPTAPLAGAAALGSAPAGRLDRLVLGGLYLTVLLVPLLLIAAAAKPGAQARLVVLGDALGFAALSLIALQVACSGRWPSTTRAFGLRPVLSLHRQAGAATLVLALVHVWVLLLDDPARVELLNPLEAPNRARAGALAVLGLVVLGVSSAARARLGLRYERWRALHLAATATVLAAAFAHVVWVDAYSSHPVVRWAVLACVLAAAAALFWSRSATPYAAALRPYRVATVRPERGGAVTLELQADGHAGLHFAPGQFVRLRPADRPYSVDDHPFSLSSSAARPDRPAVTIKALGDWTGALDGLREGARVLVDGPHGEAAHPRAVGRLLITAGIGITPALSVLRTAADTSDLLPMLLLHGSRRWADATAREELDRLWRALPNLRVVHVLSRPEPAWRGECGRVGAELLRRHAPPDLAGWAALICGPPAMVAETSAALRALGLPPAAIQAEGFA